MRGVFTHRQLRSHLLSSWTVWTFTPMNFIDLLPPPSPPPPTPFCVHPAVWTITLHSIPKTSLRLCNASWYDWIYYFFFVCVCLLLIIEDTSLSWKRTKRMKGLKKKKILKKEKKCRQKEKKCFSTTFFSFLSLIVNIFVRFFFFLNCKERSVEQKRAGSIKRY